MSYVTNIFRFACHQSRPRYIPWFKIMVLYQISANSF